MQSPDLSSPDPTQRFTRRVDDYVKYRPTYPPEIVEVLSAECGLTSTDRIGDVGAGTGILTEVLLRNGNPVVAVEPNDSMRAALMRLRHAWPSLEVVAGAAEATTLPTASVDFIVVAQAFHWFDPKRARLEFSRVLRTDHHVALLWNVRDTASTHFLRGYENLLLHFAPEYERFKAGPINRPVLSEFFGLGGFGTRTISNDVEFDLASLEGLVRSTSYAPHEGLPAFAPMIEALHGLFDACQVGGTVSMKYETSLFYGRC
jgi:SAM-dependent methyltransferase